MNKMLSSLLLLLTIGCSDWEANYITGGWPSEVEEIRIELNTRLDVDDNGYYHLELGESWQTLHRLSGTVYLNDQPLEVLKVQWESSHYWYLGDTLGYIVNRYLNDQGIYVSVDTSYVVGFDGMEVPTVNCCSYSNADGEINTMFAPVQSMEGDTATIRMYFFDEWNFEYVQEVFFVVLD